MRRNVDERFRSASALIVQVRLGSLDKFLAGDGAGETGESEVGANLHSECTHAADGLILAIDFTGDPNSFVFGEIDFTGEFLLAILNGKFIELLIDWDQLPILLFIEKLKDANFQTTSVTPAIWTSLESVSAKVGR